MAIRRLARFSLDDNSSALIQNWTTLATSTYDANNPGAGAVSWGSSGDRANLDRDFDATGSALAHLGALLTFTEAPPQFFGAVVKVTPTYSGGEDPKLELWTFASGMWTKRRRVDLPSLTRSGDAVLVDLTLGDALTGVTKVWITLAPTAAETLSWLSLHLYGDCPLEPLATPDCPAFSDPPDCSDDCDALFPDWACDPEDPTPPSSDFPFPPVTVEVPMAVIPSSSGQYVYDCPAPNQVQMYFDVRNPAMQVRVTAIYAPGIVFNEGVTQTISGTGALAFSVEHGFKYPTTPTDAYLPPRGVLDHITFLLQPLGDFTALDLLDWEQFLFLFEVAAIELC